ncbi:hypothetical protein PVOR_24219 [Paenibacillus vortex V453]|uniref:Uncharacterized protein n=2 Tax=Paenibacillus TaxID=44249 RepID=A0A163ESR1_9BACL|nr:hypothetical protein A3958_00635 [Paenibacillus glucanolyticus]AWP26654.1 hypothetical protein B9D94_08500 [Paenibacillus sp. Cedars]EFU39447.1 hypothetical protein PVOR_24219 [Paenibacillus vortex V453]AVV57496.1 hypothetical protein C7121_15920 [Paenibacillus glucanolyticus]KZS43991.1 hypothetical protein AWU65_28360 [Paenibacillus glucanolyticus]
MLQNGELHLDPKGICRIYYSEGFGTGNLYGTIQETFIGRPMYKHMCAFRLYLMITRESRVI